MMDALTSDEIRRIDNITCNSIGSINLMEDAGKKMASIILRYYKPKNVLLLVGSGGNGGDSLVCGRYLLNEGIKTTAYIISDVKNNDAISNLKLFKGEIIENPIFRDYDLIIDGILGNNQKTPLKPNLIPIIKDVNSSNSIIVSLDMPTGINTDNGLSLGEFIRSDLVISVEYPKIGLFLQDGLDSYKKLEVIKIGMVHPKDIIHIDEDIDFKGILKKRERNSNKSTYGRASIIAGSKDYAGASYISYNALNQFMMGVGYSYLYVPESLYELYALRFPEIIVSRIKDNSGHIAFDKDLLDKIMKSSDAISIGMGMGVSEDLYKTLDYLIHNYSKTLIIDADALNTISKYGIDVLNNHKANIILTPHPKEAERLSGIAVKDILDNPIIFAKEFAKKYNLILLLKGASTTISNGDIIRISAFGNSGLAKGGSGDALSGILCGIMATNGYSINNVALGSYILGMACVKACKNCSERSITISAISMHIGEVLKEIEK